MKMEAKREHKIEDSIMINTIDTILFDLDGTLYSKGKPIKTAINTIKTLRNKNFKLGFITNTDGWPVEHIHNRLINMGFNISLEEIFTPVAAVKEFFINNPNKSCYCLVTDDVVGTKAINATSILVKSGHYNEDLISKSNVKPDYIIEDITQLPDLLLREKDILKNHEYK